MPYHVYVLKSLCDGGSYVGSAGKELSERLWRHNRVDYRFTKGCRPWEIVYSEKMTSRSKAVRRERYFKTGVGRRELEQILAACKR